MEQLRSQSGSTLIIFLILIAIVASIASYSVVQGSLSLSAFASLFTQQLSNHQIEHELEVIFSNPSVCLGTVQIDSINNNFILIGSGAMQPGKVIETGGSNRLVIDKMQLLHIVDLGAGTKQADFTITAKPLDPNATTSLKPSWVRVIYTEGAGGLLSSCQFVPDFKAACERIGAVWSHADSRCKICEQLGGTWQGTLCQLP